MRTVVAPTADLVDRAERLWCEGWPVDPFDGDPQPRHVPEPEVDDDPGRYCGARIPRPGNVHGFTRCARWCPEGVCPIHGARP